MQHRDLYPALVTCIALLVYLGNFTACGVARAKYKIMAPAVTGHPDFERKLRVQQNMVEQLVFFIPSLWIFSLTVQPLIGAALGLIFAVGRILYSIGYVADPARRASGFLIGLSSTAILLLGGLIGTVRLLLLDA